jgi:hypothetical protein
MAAYVLLIAAFVLWVGVTLRRLDKLKKIPPGAYRELPGPIGMSCPPYIMICNQHLTIYAGIPYIGRVHDIPFTHNWLKFTQWGDQYGPIYQSTIFGEKHVWVMREKIAHDLLSKKGGIYADRPGIPAVPGSKSTGEYLPLLGFSGK